MSGTQFPLVSLSDLLVPVSRPEFVYPRLTYHILGARWYAKGLYTKAVKSGAEIKAKTVYRVEEGDFVYNRLFAWKGSFAVATAANHDCYVSNEFPCFTINPDRLDRRYLELYFSRESAWNEALGLSTGGTPTSRNRLKEDKLLTMHIPLPPLPEQHRIVARIEALAAKIEEARELRQEATEEAEALVTSVHLTLGGSASVPLDDIVVLDEQREAVIAGRQYPQVGIKGFGQGLFARGTLDAAQTTYKSFNRLYKGALVLSQVKGWEGAIAVCRPDLAGRYASPEYRTFRCIPDRAVPEYLAALVTTPYFLDHLKGLSRGVGARRERTRPEQFLRITIPMPTVDQQRQALELFSKLDAVKQLQAETRAKLDALLPAVLDRAFRGSYE